MVSKPHNRILLVHLNAESFGKSGQKGQQSFGPDVVHPVLRPYVAGRPERRRWFLQHALQSAGDLGEVSLIRTARLRAPQDDEVGVQSASALVLVPRHDLAIGSHGAEGIEVCLDALFIVSSQTRSWADK